jgi:hypothetical protein
MRGDVMAALHLIGVECRAGLRQVTIRVSQPGRVVRAALDVAIALGDGTAAALEDADDY